MQAMTSVSLSDEYFEGAVSVEHRPDGLKPWRLPHTQIGLFPSPGEDLSGRAQVTSGVRLRFETDSRSLRLRFLPLQVIPEVCGRDHVLIDLTLDGAVAATSSVRSGEESVVFSGLPVGRKILELWFPPEVPMVVRGLDVDAGASCNPMSDTRPVWITYGSSLTHCVRANSTARTWPAIVARRHRLNLLCLGFGGQCHLDPMVGLLIRDRPADFITLKLGINCHGSNSHNARSFPSAVLGLVRLIREKHPVTPMALVSPIACPSRETTPNAVGYTLEGMREAVRDVHARLVAAGDAHLLYADGLKVCDADLIRQTSRDGLHPNGDGIEIMADRFDAVVMQPLRRSFSGA